MLPLVLKYLFQYVFIIVNILVFLCFLNPICFAVICCTDILYKELYRGDLFPVLHTFQ